MISTWLWIGAIGMTAGLVAMVALGTTVAPERRHHVVTSSFIVAIAACAYFAMANGQGTVDVGGRTVYYARYLDWVLTTPLLLLGLITVALPRLRSAEQSRERNGIVGTVLGADVLMILTGLIATLTAKDALKWSWYAISCVAFVVVLVAIVLPVRAAARERGADYASLYDRLLGVLAALWFTYPIVWAIGTEGTKVVDLKVEVAIFAIIDLLAKVGFGLLLITGAARLGTSAKQATTTPRTA
ncbi:bacteriorhodopsin [uncultured Mycobacterium sp.]|uniref:bacteriorhodopsin n=1 Tax=uncultured Mycobacterium sp. TaxID=171292 RepID=UPI0035CA41FB